MTEHNTASGTPLEPTEPPDALASHHATSMPEGDHSLDQEGAATTPEQSTAAREEAGADLFPAGAEVLVTADQEATPGEASSRQQHQRLTRRQVLVGAGITLGMVGVSVGWC